ncbi:MAG: DUF5110 domain-containing protein [Chitinivibrionales bacterium]|nr:DUF5110 domain-containing protein [Chitinivibrionales bacterium]
MADVPKSLRFHSEPRADSKAIVRAKNARFTVLTDRCIRMEYSPDGQFEDRASQVFWFRKQPVPHYAVRTKGAKTTIETAALKLSYTATQEGFTTSNLEVALDGGVATWHFGDTDDNNLGGTLRTLDRICGSAPIGDGLMSRCGWSIIDDTNSLVFNEQCWMKQRGAADGYRDLYFFGYGSDYQGCLRDYCAISGAIPMVPRWVLGNWWSRYWAYTDGELLELMREFRKRGLPLSVCVIDMDWHEVNNPHHAGWTGYTWSKKYFPDPAGFMREMRKKLDLRISLNLHPADGIYPHEQCYESMARAMGIDPSTKQPVPFCITKPAAAAAYLKYLHHPHEKIGVDFWWMDWQQGEFCDMPGVDPLWWMNHIHYLDLTRSGKHRALAFSRNGGLGSQRYPVGFSGDTVVAWESLQFQPYLTATAANIAYTWWSHDIGGHFWGAEDPEMYLRWVQYGVFSPIMRLHASKSEFQLRMPWCHDENTLAYSRNAMQLRRRLVPYIYSMARRTHTECLPLCRPMYYAYPDREEAYHCPHQYLFGTELIVAPYTLPLDPDLRLSRRVVWLPEGEWFHFFSGKRYAGGGLHACYGTLSDTPVFARAGAIVPLDMDAGWGNPGNPKHLELRCFAGADGAFELYEDDGESIAFRDGAFCCTRIEQKLRKSSLELKIHATEGDHAQIPARRDYTLHISGLCEPRSVTIRNGKRTVQAKYAYDPALNEVTITIRNCSVRQPVICAIYAQTVRYDATQDSIERLRDHMHHFNLSTGIKDAISRNLSAIRREPSQLTEYRYMLKPAQLRCILEHITQAGIDIVEGTGDSVSFVLWNNNDAPGITYHLTNRGSLRMYHGKVGRFLAMPYRFERYQSEPCIIPGRLWVAAMEYEGLHEVVYKGGGSQVEKRP